MKHKFADDVNVNLNVDIEFNNTLVELEDLVQTLADNVAMTLVVYIAADTTRHILKRLFA